MEIMTDQGGTLGSPRPYPANSAHDPSERPVVVPKVIEPLDGPTNDAHSLEMKRDETSYDNVQR